MNAVDQKSTISHSKIPTATPSANDDKWNAVIEKAIESIVSIKYCVTSYFDSYKPGRYSATGFIVDVDNALILTNKHVCTDAPWMGKVSFRNSEEVDARVVYRDPIHDFGILQFDKASVKFQKLASIPLCPEDAKISMEVKVPGADAGEKLSILSGIIARLDRPCANYGAATYSDMNTFYIQASSNTSGGSSGSPVINSAGKCVALNAGGSTVSASSFFLPLHRVKRAVDMLAQGQRHVPRGTVQVEFVQKTYDDCRRLGLPIDLETDFRKQHPHLNGILSIKKVIPNGPAHQLLKSGDLLIYVDDKPTNHFVDLAEIMDSNVNKPVRFTVLRNSQLIEYEITIQDLHSITPSSYLSFGNDIFHPLSYNLARSYLHPVGGVFVAAACGNFGTAGIPSHAMIVAVNHRRVANMEDLVQVLSELSDGERVPVRYYNLSKKNVELVKIVTVDRNWNSAKIVTRDDVTGLWYSKLLPPPKPATESKLPKSVVFHNITPNSKYRSIARQLTPSFVYVEYRSGFGTDGVLVRYAEGLGFILSTEHGIVVTDRSSVPSLLGRVSITVANQAIVSATPIFIHPLHNLVYLKYDPSQLTHIDLVELPISDTPLHAGDKAYLVSQCTKTHLTHVHKTIVKYQGFSFFSDINPPQHRTINASDTIHLMNAYTNESGVLSDKQGRAQALWLYHSPCNSVTGTPISTVTEILDSLVKGVTPYFHTLELECIETYFWKAKSMGLSDEWVNRIFEKSNGEKYSVVAARRVLSGSESCKVVHEGDLILAIDDEVVSGVKDLVWMKENEEVEKETTLFRDGQELNAIVPVVSLTSMPKVSAVHWAGVIVQAAHRPLRFYVKHVPDGVYISVLYTGSPAHRRGLSACHIITEVNGKSTPTLEAFLEAVELNREDIPHINFSNGGWMNETQIEGGTAAPEGSTTIAQVSDQLKTKNGPSVETLREMVESLEIPSGSAEDFNDLSDDFESETKVSLNSNEDCDEDIVIESERKLKTAVDQRAVETEVSTFEPTLTSPGWKPKKSFKVTMVSLEGVTKVVTVEVDDHYFSPFAVVG
ncbi:hypothetical protein BKA69DRAFT_1026590 [Paraphysoderma sedebokerense]|nr:hypothetical protein BKA69DRAFT_1026590 [Paraphysoderma sedebokerense]